MPKRKAANIVWDHRPWKRFLPFIVEKSSVSGWLPACHTHSHTGGHAPSHTHGHTGTHTDAGRPAPPPPAGSLETSGRYPQHSPKQNVELDDVPCLYNSFQFWRIPLPAINLDEIQNPSLENVAEEMNCEETGETEAVHVDMDVQN